MESAVENAELQETSVADRYSGWPWEKRGSTRQGLVICFLPL